jgi:iron complex transport system ATP-binding protein
MHEIISIKNVSVSRGGKPVLKNINWTTYAGENWFLMGQNGSGKTTLIEILVGYLWPQEGSVSILGEEFGHISLRELRAKVGYVFFMDYEKDSALRSC